MTNDETMTKPEFTKEVRCHSNFAVLAEAARRRVIGAFIRHSSFGIRHFAP
jgi:hypothetical protein